MDLEELNKKYISKEVIKKIILNYTLPSNKGEREITIKNAKKILQEIVDLL